MLRESNPANDGVLGGRVTTGPPPETPESKQLVAAIGGGSVARRDGDGVAAIGRERVETSDRAWAGVLRGTLPTAIAWEDCDVITEGLPMWGLVAEAMGLRIRTLWTNGERWRTVSREWWPGATVKDAPVDRAWNRETSAVVLADSCVLPGADSPFWTGRVDTVVWQAFRGEKVPQCPDGWMECSRRVWHPRVGGVVDGKWMLGIWVQHRPTGAPVIPPRPSRVLLTVMDSCNGGVEVDAPTGGGTEAAGRVVRLRPGTYSTSGLFPLLSPPARFITPSVYSKTGFVKRALTAEEMAAAWDLPILFRERLGKERIARALPELTRQAPCKLLHVVGAALLHWGRGGRADAGERGPELGTPVKAKPARKRRHRSPDEKERKRRRPEGGTPHTFSFGQLVFDSDSDPHDSAWDPVKDGSDGSKDESEEADEVNRHESESEEGDSSWNGSAGSNGSSRSSWIKEDDGFWEEEDWSEEEEPIELAELRAGGPDPFEGEDCPAEEERPQVGESAGKESPEWSREEKVRALKADGQKADDAAVPKFLWDDELADERRERGLDLPNGWEAALDGFREFGAGFWKRQLRRCFSLWFRRRNPTWKALSRRVTAKGDIGWYQDYRDWRELRDRRVKGEKKDVGQDEWVFWDATECRYKWRKGGKRRYRTTLHRLGKSKDFQAGKDCLTRGSDSSWWRWDAGSRCHFWRWPDEFREAVRDGQAHWLVSELPKFRRPQRKPVDEERLGKEAEKINKVRKMGYIVQGVVRSLTHYFSVEKGLTDIRMVYNGSSSGLNSALWAPHFSLPTVTQELRSIVQGTHMADRDIGDMFLNFLLGEEVREYCGVDVSWVRSADPEDAEWEKSRLMNWERWERDMMGLLDSPFRAIQVMTWLKEIIYGDPEDPGNPFRWDRVELNLPCSRNYDPRRPWVAKVRKCGTIASDVYIYVDDVRPVGQGRKDCLHASRRFGSLCGHYGVNDAARKVKGPDMKPGPWAGTMVYSDEGVDGLVSQQKWDKTKGYVRELREEVNARPEELQRARLESMRGFLIYVARTYRNLNPYLKGVHLTVDSWRPYRDKEGWKLAGKELMAAQAEKKIVVGPQERGPPTVKAVPRLARDLEALERLTASETPPRRPYRAKARAVAYLLGDASGGGFGSALLVKEKVDVESGEWREMYRGRTSNWREADNLVTRTERGVKEGSLMGVEMFLVTDNEVFERCYYNGTSSSPQLFETTLRLHEVEIAGNLIVHVVHVAGTRMKAAGIDGLSRGDMLEGMLLGRDPLQYVPLDKGALERSGGAVEEWIRSWWGGGNLVTLRPEGWFREAHGHGAFLWSPPPAAMETALEMLAEARHKRPYSAHVVVVPRLMTHLWRKQLGKDADLMVTAPVGLPFWESNQHEPLILAILLPVVRRKDWKGPWVFRGSLHSGDAARRLDTGWKLAVGREPAGRDELEGELREVRETPAAWSGSVLRKFLGAARSVPSLPEGVVRRMLSEASQRQVPDQQETP